MASGAPQIPGLTDWRPLARGGFATVWQARQQSLNRLVAVKVDQRKLDTDGEQRRFLREAGAAGRMSGHPGIVTVHDAGILVDDRPYLVMELCPGGSLSKWLKPEARPAQRRVRDVGVRIADALAAAHSRGVLHRDVKPANILIDAYENAGLADFGLAAMPEPGVELAQTLEALTPAYAPPESFQQEPPTEHGDVYSLAATLYALLAGHPPRWTGVDKPSITDALAALEQPIQPIPDVDPALMDLLMAGLADEPSERPSAAHFRDQLAALDLPDGAVAALPNGGSKRDAAGESLIEEPDPSVERRERRRSLAVLAVVAVLISLGVLVTVTLLSPGSPAAQPASPTSGTGGTAGPTGMESPTSSTSEPTPPNAPTGFADCSADLGARTYCATSYECWGGLIIYQDLPALGTAQDCYADHVYQTFAGGELDYEVRRQSQLEKDKQVKKVCSADVVNQMVGKDQRRDDWEVYVLPPQQAAEDNLYRCIFGRGERDKPLTLNEPS